MQCTIIDSLFQTLRSLLDAEKDPRDYGTGQPLYKAEIRLLEAIHRYPEAKATDLAQQLGITRGALTQMSNRLAEKALVERFTLPENKKEKYLRLTGRGEAAWKAHQSFHSDANAELCEFFRSLSREEKHLILEFLGKVEDAAPIARCDCQLPKAETCM